MRRRHELIHSPDLGRNVHVWAFGHWGDPLLVFPSAGGMAHEWDAQGMIQAIAPWIHGGHFKVYCPETNVSQTLNKADAFPGQAMERHLAYERFIMNTLVPAMRHDCNAPDAKIMATGCSLGGYYSANYALRHPETFHRVLCMSGRYHLPDFLRSHKSLDVYLNNPLWYVPRLEGEELEKVRRNTHLTLVCGRGAWEDGCIEETIEMANILAAKGISHDRDIWGLASEHGWPWWRKQVVYHLNKIRPLKK
jgi:esterase/lipase superfamily enzyme